MRDTLRRVILRPYRKGSGPSFILTIGDPVYATGRDRLSYTLVQRDGRKSTPIFSGSDFGPSPLHAWDSDDTVKSLLGFLTLRPGDTDAEYFERYTPEQMAFVEQHAEYLAYEVYSRFGE